VLKLVRGEWVQRQLGPQIQKTQTKLFYCTGIHQLNTKKDTEELLVVSLKGQNYSDVKVFVEIQELQDSSLNP